LKPAVKTRPHHRGGMTQPKQPINKTIGINKLGTLLSSQTTDTPGTTTTSQPWIAPEQLFKLTRFPAPMQIRISGFSSAGNASPPNFSALKSYQNLVLNLGVWPPAVTSSSLSPSRRLRKQYTQHRPTANPLLAVPKRVPKPRRSGQIRPLKGATQAPPS
jgi:hypothetical protein